MSGFARFVWFNLFYNLFVIAWGALVRATNAGAGCGSNWPTCNGELVPQLEDSKTLIEFVHRITSSVSLILTVAMVILACKLFERGSRVRKAAWTTLAFMLSEAALGAGLVIFELVEDNDSVARAVVISLHLTNTLFLLAFMALTAWWSDRPGRLDFSKAQAPWLAACITGVFVVGVTGAIAALGDTLFPATSLAEGIAADLQPDAHFLLKLRGLHPLFSILVGVGLLFLAHENRQNRLGKLLLAIVVLQVVVGFINLGLLAPIPLQLVHLFIADLLWIVLVLLCAKLLESDPKSLGSETILR